MTISQRIIDNQLIDLILRIFVTSYSFSDKNFNGFFRSKRFNISSFAKASYKTTFASANAFAPLSVSKSGSPGPAPTKVTLGCYHFFMHQLNLWLCMLLFFRRKLLRLECIFVQTLQMVHSL